ncbi:MAG TPA: PqqD family protein [Terracidiphilus sp.]|nr:PqqD family protein [Terracidiphilus sp.]
MRVELLRLNHGKILFEEFEREIVVVNTESGFYYSLSGSGPRILRLLDDGCPPDVIPEKLIGTNASSSSRQDIEAFICRLRDAEIVVEGEEDLGQPPAETADVSAFQAAADYETPVFERFEDLQELLLIDPVHQVDQDYGWPKPLRKPGAAGVGHGKR